MSVAEISERPGVRFAKTAGIYLGAITASAFAAAAAKGYAIDHGMSVESARWVNALVNALPQLYYGPKILKWALDE